VVLQRRLVLVLLAVVVEGCCRFRGWGLVAVVVQAVVRGVLLALFGSS
jgi:hypothetical protein